MSKKEKTESISREKRIRKSFQKPSLTQQEFAENADINIMLKKLVVSKDPIAMARLAQPNFNGVDTLDLSEIGDYKESLDRVLEVQNNFNNLPADWRKKFGQDPVQFLQYIADPDNREVLENAGLMHPAEPSSPPPPEPVPVVMVGDNGDKS